MELGYLQTYPSPHAGFSWVTDTDLVMPTKLIDSEDMDIRSCVFEDSTVVDAEVTVEVAPEGSRLLHTRQG